jgi:hypothetical protein
MDPPREMQGAPRFLRHCLLCVAIGILVAFPVSADGASPSNDDFANARDLGSGPTASASGTNRWATAEAGEPDHYPGIPAIRSVWYRWTAPASGPVGVDTCGSDFDTILAVYRGSAVNVLGRVAFDDDSCAPQSRARFFATAGTTYQIAVDGYGGDQGSIKLDLRPALSPSNDDFANAFDLGSELAASASGTTVDATPEPGEPNHWYELQAAASVWYQWTAATNRRVQIDTCDSDFDTVLAVYTGSALDALRPVARDDDWCDLASRVDFDATSGTSYRIAVDGYWEGSFNLALAPSNQFRFGKLQRNKRRGTAQLAVNVPNPGDLRLARSKRIRGAAATAEEAGELTLAVNPRPKARRALRKRGSVFVKAKVTYSPEAGQPNTRAKRVKLVKRR